MAEKEEPLAPTAMAQIAELMDIARGLLRQAEAGGVTMESVRVLEGVRKLIMSGSEVTLREAKIRAMRTEKVIKTELDRDEIRLAVYEALLEGLETPEGVERMRYSIGGEVRAMRNAGVRVKSYSALIESDED